MGSGGTEFATEDNVEHKRLNQKTKLIATGAYINATTESQAGQQAYCLKTNGNFLVDRFYNRMAANTAWNPTAPLAESAEQNSTPVADDTSVNITVTRKRYAFFTLPSTEKWYVITGIEWKNGSSVAGNIISGVDISDTNPPTLARTLLVALGQELIQAGINAVQRSSVVRTKPIRAGTKLGIWCQGNSVSGALRFQSGNLGDNYKDEAYTSTPGLSDGVAFSNSSQHYLKVYFRGYS